ncbi:catechol 1,2-dioxygenase 2, partial [Acinetobacter sp. 869535]
GPVDERIQQVVVRLLGDLFQAIEDLDIQPSEVWKGLEYLTDAGQANELGLLAAGLGLEHYLDLRADEADAKAGILAALPVPSKARSMWPVPLSLSALPVWMTAPSPTRSTP